MKDSEIFYDLCEYFSDVYPKLNGEQLREVAMCGLVQADTIAQEFVEEMRE